MASITSAVERDRIRRLKEDPVYWARVFLISNNAAIHKYGPWVARDYQEEMLRDKSVRKVYRCGRRCLPEWVHVVDPDTGEWKTVKELYESKTASVAAMDPDSYEITKQSNCPVSYNGEKEVFNLLLENGDEIDATGNHPFFTVAGWKELQDLKPGDYVAVPTKLDFWGNTPISDNDAKFLAYMIGDGNCTQKVIRFTQMLGTKQLAEMKEIVQSYGCFLKHYDCDPNPYDFHIVKVNDRHNRTVKNEAKEVLKRYGVFGHNADNKTIPKEIFMAPKRSISLFLSRLYATDGWASVHLGEGRTTYNIEIGYCSNSELLIKGLVHLLLRYGIHAVVRKKKKSWIASVHDRDGIITFAHEIGIYGKEEAVNRCLEEALKKNIYDDYMPFEVNQEIQQAMEAQNISKYDLVREWEPVHRPNGRLRFDRKLQRGRVQKMAKRLGLKDLEALASGQIMWRKVKSIHSIGVYPTYDLSVPEYHNFVANDIITHNTGKSETMIVEGLHKAYTHKNFRILYVTPYENQVNLIFTRMRELIHDSPLLKQEVVKMKNSPYTVELKNGSTILGFTTGASSNSGAASIRGQRADAIFMDEIDYMAENDYSTVAAIAGERVDISICASSTPTGKRSTFYRMCTDPSFGYHQHFHPSMDNPNWCKQMEDQFRSEMTDSQYEHEILAEFGTEEMGVFNKEKLDLAMTFDYYAYNELTDMQQRKCKEENAWPTIYTYGKDRIAPYNPFRCVGIKITPTYRIIII